MNPPGGWYIIKAQTAKEINLMTNDQGGLRIDRSTPNSGKIFILVTIALGAAAATAIIMVVNELVTHDLCSNLPISYYLSPDEFTPNKCLDHWQRGNLL